MKDDKIFNNTFGQQDLSENPVSFKIESSYEDKMDPDDRIHYNMMMDRIDDIIINSEFDKLNKVTADGINKKLNKIQINKVFFYIIDRIGRDYTKIDIFPNKFYNSLSNKYKDELMIELDKKYNIRKKRGIGKLF